MSEGRVIRYTLDERIHHWLAGITYVYCLITGLAFWSPYLFWLAALVGGGATARYWHPWSGVIFAISVVWMGKLWHKDMATTDADRKWSHAMKYYIENQDEKLPPIGRFNYGQKIFFWVMLWGGLLLLISGVGLWFVESIPPWLRHLSIAVHVIAALATIGGFIVHIYMGTALVRGGFSAIVTGDVTAAWARHHHRLWYEQVTRK
jgi:formate dehydrogenase subunit gamma